jgi:small subunit ribosomal protein S21
LEIAKILVLLVICIPLPLNLINLLGDIMTQIIVGENEGIESALRRFKRQVSKAEIFPDIKKHRHFETPLEKRKRKAVAKQKQRRRKFRTR